MTVIGSMPTLETPSPAPDPSATLMRSMRRIAQAIDVRSKEIGRSTGLTIPQLIVLQSIRTLGQVTTQAVSRDAAMSLATVVAVLDKLAGKGLIERYRSAVDRRVVHARLTAEGERSLAEAPGLLGERFLDRFAALPLEERAVLARSLAAVAAMMAEIPPGPA